MSINPPEWIQAAAAVAIVYFTGRSLVVLKDYAADTKKIAETSIRQADIGVLQVENAQKPFVTMVSKPGNPATHFDGGWHIENQGSGPALNMRYTSPLDATQMERDIPLLGKGEFRHLTRFVLDQVWNHERQTDA